MKKIIVLVLCVSFIVLFVAGCNNKKSVELTDEDLEYINTVYNNLEQWDYSIKNSGQTWTINKIAFYDFDGTNNICFYTLYPVTDIYGWGYFVDKSSMYSMDFGVYETDKITISRGWVARTSANGISWDSTAGKEDKYEKLKEAFIYYKENNIYK